MQLTINKAKGQIYVAGDFNGRVGKNNEGIDDIIGIFGENTINNNWERLIDFCLIDNLIISNTWLPHKNVHRYTHEEPSRNKRL